MAFSFTSPGSGEVCDNEHWAVSGWAKERKNEALFKPRGTALIRIRAAAPSFNATVSSMSQFLHSCGPDSPSRWKDVGGSG